jgi:hypothetical protein
MSLTAERLREVLHYDPETGVFTRLQTLGRGRAGAVAGCLRPDGYLEIGVDYGQYLVHRLAWLYTYSKWPPHHIDHINSDRLDNRVSNLRLATSAENGQNRCGANRHSKSGVLGVSWDESRQKWVVQIKLDRKRVHMSRHTTLDEAAEVRRQLELRYHPFAKSV